MPAEQIRNIVAAGERTSRDIFFQAAASLLEDVHLKNRHGLKVVNGLNTGDFQTIWDHAHNYPRILSAGKIGVVSTSADDDVAGTGARVILISGCDADGNPQMELVETGGLTPVLSSKDFFWMDAAHVIKSGSAYGGAAGTITFTHQGSVELGDTPIVGTVEPEWNRMIGAVAVVPNHYSGYILNAEITGPNAQQALIAFRISGWLDDTDSTSVQQIVFPHTSGGGGPSQLNGKTSERIHFPSLVEMVGVALSGMNLTVASSFSLLAVHDKYDFSIPADMFDLSAEQLEKLFEERPGLFEQIGSINFTNPE